jgi:outer membrane protein OmpA-like peptidoglycan-associated protein
MSKKKNDFFWASYADMMTSLFFIMLVLFVLIIVVLKKEQNQTELEKKELEKRLQVFDLVDKNIKPLKEDTILFAYEKEYKRFKLAFDVKFIISKDNLSDPSQIYNALFTQQKIIEAGKKLKTIIDNLNTEKRSNSALKNISYVVVIAGYASRNGEENSNYQLSYRRALSLRDFWKNNGIDFEDNQYSELVDLQIAGNGWGGIGRTSLEDNNQRFLIQIFPKIGDINELNNNQ